MIAQILIPAIVEGNPMAAEFDAGEYMPLVRVIARRMYKQLAGHMEYDELVGWGALGLVQASRRWDLSTPYKFMSYAIWRIRGAMLDASRKYDGYHRPTRERRMNMVSLDRLRDKDGNLIALEEFGSSKPYNTSDEWWADILAKLKPSRRDRVILELRVLHGLGGPEIARIVHMSPSGVNLILTKAYADLRNFFANRRRQAR